MSRANARLRKTVIQSWKTKKRSRFAVKRFAHYAQTLQNATPRHDSSLWCIAFFPPSPFFLTPHSHWYPVFNLFLVGHNHFQLWMLHFHTVLFRWQFARGGVITPSQLISTTTLFGAIANDSLGDAGKRPLSGLRCIDLNTTNTHTAAECLCREASGHTQTQREPSISTDWHLHNYRHSLANAQPCRQEEFQATSMSHSAD